MNLNIFLFDGALMFAVLAKIMIWKGKKRNINFPLQNVKKILLARQYLRLTYEDQQEINLYTYYIKNTKQDLEQVSYSNK